LQTLEAARKVLAKSRGPIMGLLFTTPGTQRILDTLNTAFDGPDKGLQFIRDHADSNILKKVDGRKWAPGHLAKMLKLVPFDQATGSPDVPDETARWWWFLRKLVGKQATKDFLFDPLCQALADAILKQDHTNGKAYYNIVKVSFDHVELPAAQTEKDDPPPNLVIFDAPWPGIAGAKVRHITLLTVRARDKDDPPSLDGDEKEIAETPRPPWVKS
jgi:hypothetical protein